MRFPRDRRPFWDTGFGNPSSHGWDDDARQPADAAGACPSAMSGMVEAFVRKVVTR
jgi:hypothetical protein